MTTTDRPVARQPGRSDAMMVTTRLTKVEGGRRIELTSQNNLPSLPRSSRDTYLGAAAAALASSYLLRLLGQASLGFSSDTRVLALTFQVLDVAGLLALSAGFAFAVVGLLGRPSSRAAWLRRAGRAWVVANLAIFAGYTAAFFIDPFVSGPTPEFYRTQIISSLTYALFLVIAAMLVARAFGSASNAEGRRHLLAWALAVVGAGVALPLLYQVVAGWWNYFPLSEPGNAFGLVRAVFLILAAASGAAAFFQADRPLASPSPERFVRREARLALASLLLLVAYVFGFVAAILFARLRTHGFQVFMSQPDIWLRAAGDAVLVAAGALATLGFLASRRSSSGRDAALSSSAVTAGQ